MKSITTHYAKTHLSRLLKDVAKGAEISILCGRTPVGRLVPVGRGSAGGRPTTGTVTSAPVTCAPDAFAPMDSAALRDWGL